MHETESDLVALQATLDETYRLAGEHLRSIHTPERRMNASQVCDHLRGVCVLNLATVSQGCAPFVAPVDGLFYRGRFWFGSAPNSLRFRHIRKNPQVSAAYTLGEKVSMILHGLAHEIDTCQDQYQGLHDYLREVYGPQFDSWGYWGEFPYAWIEARRFYAMQMPAPES
jgi:nitroimidazol reductase NimA-like FMN-containing flavoprotein (pyridoxamine 5'-phosphate oxidase superfamily)